MKTVKYIALDFDGTILNSNGEISPNLAKKLIDLQELGYKIVLCSGRSYKGIEWVAKKINLADYDGYMIAHNGSQIYENKDGVFTRIHNINFTKEEVKRIADLIEDKAKAFVTYCDEKMGTSNIIERLKKSSQVMGLELSEDYIKETPKIVLVDDEDNINDIRKEVENIVSEYDDSINVFSSCSTLIEITPSKSQKGEALKILADNKGLSHEEFICFGDQANDISMFEFCKFSVAMDNAIEEVKEISTHKTKTNNEDGVFHFLNNNF